MLRTQGKKVLTKRASPKRKSSLRVSTSSSFSSAATGNKGKQAKKAKSSDAVSSDAIAKGLSSDLTQRIVNLKLRKPTLEERLVLPEQMYTAKALTDVNEGDYLTCVPMNMAGQQPFMQYYLRREAEATGGYWMVRHFTLAALNFLDAHVNKIHVQRPVAPDRHTNSQTENLAIIYGHRGTGKSFTLAQAIDYARLQNWIVVDIGGFDTIHDMDGVLQHSSLPDRAGSYDQVLKCRNLLHRLADTYPEQLKSLQLTKPREHYMSYGDWDIAEDDRFNAPDDLVERPESYPFPDNAKIPRPLSKHPGMTLFDLAGVGAWRVDLAARACSDLLDELSEQTAFPVFVGIDDVNAMFQKLDFVDPGNFRTKLDATKSTFVQSLFKLANSPPRRGCTMIATSAKFTQYRVPELMESAGTRIFTKAYENGELQAALLNYSFSRFLLSPVDIEMLRRCQATTGNQPKLVYQFALSQ